MVKAGSGLGLQAGPTQGFTPAAESDRQVGKKGLVGEYPKLCV